MHRLKELKSEIQEAKKLRLSWRTKVLIIVISALATFLFALYGRLELALPLMNVIGVLGLMILFKWKLRRYVWFWITMAVVAALHVPLIFFVPWATKWVPAVAIAGIDSADFCLILWVLILVEKFAGKQKIAIPEAADETRHSV
jgi:hypothetical protein